MEPLPNTEIIRQAMPAPKESRDIRDGSDNSDSSYEDSLKENPAVRIRRIAPSVFTIVHR
jgi:hypothetical protein